MFTIDLNNIFSLSRSLSLLSLSLCLSHSLTPHLSLSLSFSLSLSLPPPLSLSLSPSLSPSLPPSLSLSLMFTGLLIGLPGEQQLYVRRSHMRPEPYHDELHTFRSETEHRRHCGNEGWICVVAECCCRHDMK